MAEITRPHIVWKDGTPEEQARNGRLMLDWMAQQVQKLRAENEATYTKKSDRVVADALRIMEGEVSLDKAVRPGAGDIFYAIDGKYAAFGTGATPAPTDPGTGPAGGVTDGDKGDIRVSGTGAMWTIDNDVVTFAKMQNVTGPVLIGRHTNTAGDLTTISIPTAVAWFSHEVVTEITGTGAAITVQGTSPDAYTAFPMGAVAEVDFELFWPLSPYWRTGTIEVFLHWAVTALEASNWQPVAESLVVAAGGSLVAAGTDLAPGVISANVTADTRQRTSLGTITVAAGDHLRIVVGRNPGAGGDGYTGTVLFLGVELAYTPIY